MIIKNNIIPFDGFAAITLWPFIFVRERFAMYFEFTERWYTMITHEGIHCAQQRECLTIGAAIAVVMVMAGCGWWSVVTVPFFFWWYLVEWAIRLIVMRNSHKAYRAISFEAEAYDHENEEDYLSERRTFNWITYLWK